MKFLLFLSFVLVCLAGAASSAPLELPDLNTVPPDLVIPPLSSGKPGPGIRVVQTTEGWQAPVHHVLYLPRDWKPSGSYPVIVEYAGNGGYTNKFGDVSEGIVEGSRLGYGMSGGSGFIWICMPYVENHQDGSKQNAVKWWGDLDETKRYCRATVQDVCARFGGDAQRVILCGFSRGSIGCHYIGLHDDTIAKLWRGFVCHSHYDGVLEKWPYPQADRASAMERLKRLNGRPQFISHEGSIQTTEEWLHSTGIKGDWTFAPIPFRNHSDAWVLRDIPERQRLREWLVQVLK